MLSSWSSVWKMPVISLSRTSKSSCCSAGLSLSCSRNRGVSGRTGANRPRESCFAGTKVAWRMKASSRLPGARRSKPRLTCGAQPRTSARVACQRRRRVDCACGSRFDGQHFVTVLESTPLSAVGFASADLMSEVS